MVSPEVQADVRQLRSKEQWLRYDSVLIGPGARDIDPTFFNTWAELVAADSILFNAGQRSANVGLAYTNQSSEREDFAQDIYQSGVEFIAPPGIQEFETDQSDALLMPLVFTQEIPNRSSFRVEMADTDTIALVPGVHLPAGVGTTATATDDSSSNVTIPGHTGTADVRNTWNWPEPVKIPAKGQFNVRMRIDRPWKQCLSNFTAAPGNKVIPFTNPELEQVGTFECPNLYIIRVWHRGPRYVQLRGARSS
jgi:hypothetical protein